MRCDNESMSNETIMKCDENTEAFVLFSLSLSLSIFVLSFPLVLGRLGSKLQRRLFDDAVARDNQCRDICGKLRGCGLTCQVERWRGWKSGMRRGCGVVLCDADERSHSVDRGGTGLIDSERALLVCGRPRMQSRVKSNE